MYGCSSVDILLFFDIVASVSAVFSRFFATPQAVTKQISDISSVNSAQEARGVTRPEHPKQRS
jgi:hypothetical protein